MPVNISNPTDAQKASYFHEWYTDPSSSIIAAHSTSATPNTDTSIDVRRFLYVLITNQGSTTISVSTDDGTNYATIAAGAERLLSTVGLPLLVKSAAASVPYVVRASATRQIIVGGTTVEGLPGLLADPQTPTAHAGSHKAGGSDPTRPPTVVTVGMSECDFNGETAVQDAIAAITDADPETNRYGVAVYPGDYPYRITGKPGISLYSVVPRAARICPVYAFGLPNRIITVPDHFNVFGFDMFMDGVWTPDIGIEAFRVEVASDSEIAYNYIHDLQWGITIYDPLLSTPSYRINFHHNHVRTNNPINALAGEDCWFDYNVFLKADCTTPYVCTGAVDFRGASRCKARHNCGEIREVEAEGMAIGVSFYGVAFAPYGGNEFSHNNIYVESPQAIGAAIMSGAGGILGSDTTSPNQSFGNRIRIHNTHATPTQYGFRAVPYEGGGSVIQHHDDIILTSDHAGAKYTFGEGDGWGDVVSIVSDKQSLAKDLTGTPLSADQDVTAKLTILPDGNDGTEALIGTPTLALGGTGADNIRTVTITLKDAAGNAIANPSLARVWVSDAAKGIPSGTGVTSTVADTTGGTITETEIAVCSFQWLSEVTSGAIKVKIDSDTTADLTKYVNVEYRGVTTPSAIVVFNES